MTKTDGAKFIVCFVLFFVLIFSYNQANSPYIPTTYDSASINNREVSSDAIQLTSQSPISEDTSADTRISIAFRPEHVSIDSSLIDAIRTTVSSHYFEQKTTPLSLLFDGARKDPRGQVSGNTLILSAKIPSEIESIKVLVHELGHIVDIRYLQKTAWSSDPSEDFYDISWQDYTTKKKDAKIADFVSGYALSNKYEDFAESFAFYVFHNTEFARRAKTNFALREKYNFLHEYVFADDAFFGTSFELKQISSYNWDVTKISINEKKYLYYIK